MKILAIDPGYNGSAVLMEKTKQDELPKIISIHKIANENKLSDLNTRVTEVLKFLLDLVTTLQPDVIAVEDYCFYNGRSNNASGFIISKMLGGLMAHSLITGMPIYIPQRPTMLNALCGSPRADKAQVRKIMQLRFAFCKDLKPIHALDAVIVGLYTFQYLVTIP